MSELSKYRRASAIINLDAIKSNMLEIKRHVSGNSKLMMIIKADAYGHGCVPIARMLEALDGKCGYDELINAYGVAIIEEGIKLRQCGVKKPILILGYTAPELFEDVIEYDITQTVFQLDTARRLSGQAVSMGKTAHVHIKVDTGMGRIGFDLSDRSVSEIKKIAELPNIIIDGLFSHLSKADETDKSYSKLQFDRFIEFADKLEEAGVAIPIKHISNSAGVIDMPEMNLDMVRTGIINYGLYPSTEVDKGRLELQPALEWKTHVSYVKTVEAGSLISYGGTYEAAKKIKVATIPVGYADGYPRLLSSKGRVIIRGKYANIIGRICMDQFMVDVSEIEGVRQGDEVTLVGRDGDAFIPIEEPADLAGSFNYEFACTIGNRIPRVYIG